jgi:uncharacterized iron-regulated membrane protein
VKRTFTLSMAWLHTWGSLVVSWVLFCVLLTGSICVFRGELTYWLTPEIRSGVQLDAPRSLAIGEAYLREHGAGSRLWRVTLPTTREPVVKVTWRTPKGKTEARQLDPETGAEIRRDTEGGDFFLEMHEGLHIDRGKNLIGFWIVCITGMAMIVASISGVVIHKRIFKDLFLFRPRASKHRAWLDAHNVFGVLALPFHVMMAFTGILLLYWLFIPSAAGMVYPDGNPEFRREANGQTYRQMDVDPGAPAPLKPLQVYVDKAETFIGKGRTAYVYVRDPGRENAVIEPHRERTERVSQQVDQIALGADGRVIRKLLIAEKSPLFRLQSHMAAWHWLEWGGNLVRWFFFLTGLMSSALVATGLVVFVEKRANRRGAERWLAWVEKVNVAAVAGLCVACVAFPWAERLVPVEAAGRAELPVQAFFAVWVASLVHALVRPARSAWVEQLGAAALLCVGAPLLQGQMLRHLAEADWVRLTVDATLLAAGLAFGMAAWAVAGRAPRLRPAAAEG